MPLIEKTTPHRQRDQDGLIEVPLKDTPVPDTSTAAPAPTIASVSGDTTKGLAARLHELGLKSGALSLFLKRHFTKPDQAFLNKGQAGLQSGLERSKPFGDKLSRNALWAARSVRRRTKPARLNKDYRRFLHLAQELGYDSAIEKLFFVPARGVTALEDVSIDSPNQAHGHDYHPIHRLSFDWAMAQLPSRLSDYTFVDYGAGRGRALLLASMHGFRRIIGVEFAAELQDDAAMNIAQFPRSLMKCRDVECLLMDAADFPIPEGKAVFLINDSFDTEVMEALLARLAASYRAHPRPFYLILVHPQKAAGLDWLMQRSTVFEPVYHSRSEKMRLQVLSPDIVQIFKTHL